MQLWQIFKIKLSFEWAETASWDLANLLDEKLKKNANYHVDFCLPLSYFYNPHSPSSLAVSIFKRLFNTYVFIPVLF